MNTASSTNIAALSSATLSSFDTWLNVPVHVPCTNPRFEVHRACPQEYPAIYRLIDIVYGRTPSKARHEWLYLDNPNGIARALVVTHVESGQVVSAAAGWPWPVAIGDRRLFAMMGGDSVTHPDFQRQGLSNLRREQGEAHPFHGTFPGIGCPNATSRTINQRDDRDVPVVFGPLPFGVLVLDACRYLRAHDLAPTLANACGRAIDSLHRSWHRTTLPAHDTHRVVEIERFDDEAGALANRFTRIDGYWFPRDASYLNWRYLDHPTHEYLARGVYQDDTLAAIGIVRISGDHALVMELIAPETDQALAQSTLRALVSAARDAGCNRMNFYATPNFHHWPLFRRAGFISRPRSSGAFRDVFCTRYPEVLEYDNWLMLPGDSDVE